jgi:ribonuclease P protein component
VLYVCPAEGPDSRLGLSVGKRLGRATRRNVLKRRLREAFRLLRPEFPAPVDVVAIPLGAAAGRKTPEIREELRGLLARARARPR